jgi:hypothetical protein
MIQGEALITQLKWSDAPQGQFVEHAEVEDQKVIIGITVDPVKDPRPGLFG